MDLSLDYFALFALPCAFEIDAALLAERYRGLQQNVHPDRHVGATDHEQRLAMQYTTFVNEAYTTLKSPLSRAIYLLELAGSRIEENPSLDPGFLMEQIELREALEETNSEAAAGAFLKRIDGAIGHYEAEFVAALDDHPAQAEQAVYKLQFMHKLRAEAEAVEEGLLDY